MVKKHPLLWSGLILLLVVLNLWKWLPGAKQKVGGLRPGVLGQLTLEFPLPPSAEEKTLRRDLFALSQTPLSAKSGSHKKIMAKKGGVVAPVKPTNSPTPSPLAKIAAGYRLMGVVSREGRNEALLGKGDQLFQVAPGDDLEGLYRVDAINQDEVYLTEKQTGNTLKLRVSDQQGIKHGTAEAPPTQKEMTPTESP